MSIFPSATSEMNEGKYETFLDTMEWRDQAMHDNLMWLATEVYPNEKFIVWGHNDHIRKAQSEVMGSPYPITMMGEKLSEEMKNTVMFWDCMHQAVKQPITPEDFMPLSQQHPVPLKVLCLRRTYLIASWIFGTRTERPGTPGCSNHDLHTAGA